MAVMPMVVQTQAARKSAEAIALLVARALRLEDNQARGLIGIVDRAGHGPVLNDGHAGFARNLGHLAIVSDAFLEVYKGG